MKFIVNENAEAIIQKLIPKKILDLNPVIAGGFVVGLYFAAIRYSSSSFDQDLKRLIEKKKDQSDFVNELGFKKKFTDIDLWFLKDNPIWQKEHLLLKNFPQDPVFGSNPRPKPSIWATAAKPPRRPDFSMSETEFRNEFLQYGLDANIKNSTYWANSFTTRASQSMKIQFVKKQYQSVEELFSKFDILNCCAAYHQGLFYFHDEFENVYNDGILAGGETFNKRSLLSKIWASSRTFKYANRFNLEFSPQVCHDLTMTFVDANYILKDIKNKNYSSTTTNIQLGKIEGIDDPYGKNMDVSIEKVQGMIGSMFGKFPELIGMKYFDPNKIFLFMGSDNHSVMKAVEEYLEKNKDKFDV